MTKFTPFDAADYLTDEETIAEYLNTAMADSNPDFFGVAERDVTHARLKNQVIQSGEKAWAPEQNVILSATSKCRPINCGARKRSVRLKNTSGMRYAYRHPTKVTGKPLHF